MTIPKLPPPPRRAQNRSAFSVAVAFTTVPSAVTISAPIRLSHVKPSLRSSQPLPLPSASPMMPVSGTRPPVTASPCSCVAASNSPQLSPASARTVRASGSTAIAFMPRMSIIRPSSITAAPVTLWPPPYTEIGRAWARGELHRGDDVVGAPAHRDQRGPTVDHAVEDGPRLVVPAVAGAELLSAEAGDAEIGRTGGHRCRPFVRRPCSRHTFVVHGFPDHQGRHPEFTEGADDPIRPRLRTLHVVVDDPTPHQPRPERPDIGEAADVTGAPVGRRVFLGLVGVGAVGVLLGAQAQDWLERVVGPLISKDGTGLASLLPIGRFRIYTVTGDLPSRSRAD